MDEEKRTHKPEVELKKYQAIKGVKTVLLTKILRRRRQINVSQHHDATSVSTIHKTRNSILQLNSEYNFRTSME
jgi:hypothetical protein